VPLLSQCKSAAETTDACADNGNILRAILFWHDSISIECWIGVFRFRSLYEQLRVATLINSLAKEAESCQLRWELIIGSDWLYPSDDIAWKWRSVRKPYG
jgi:hypothetical protein